MALTGTDQNIICEERGNERDIFIMPERYRPDTVTVK